MRFLIILAAICFSVNAFAKDATPKTGTKQAKPKEPTGCKFVGRVNGTKLWAGDCDRASNPVAFTSNEYGDEL